MINNKANSQFEKYWKSSDLATIIHIIKAKKPAIFWSICISQMDSRSFFITIKKAFTRYDIIKNPPLIPHSPFGRYNRINIPQNINELITCSCQFFSTLITRLSLPIWLKRNGNPIWRITMKRTISRYSIFTRHLPTST